MRGWKMWIRWPIRQCLIFVRLWDRSRNSRKKKSGNRVLAYGITVCAAAAALALGMNYLSRNPGILGGRDVQTDSSAVAGKWKDNGFGTEKKGRLPAMDSRKRRQKNGSSRAVSENRPEYRRNGK